MKPRVYLAGKIGKKDWRHDLVPGLRGRLWSGGAVDTPSFEYTGPFFVSCDHGCRHGKNLHGAVGSSECMDESANSFSPSDVVTNNLHSLEQADLVLAYINAYDCFGTLFELGWAMAKCIPVVVCFSPKVDRADFWFSIEKADAIHQHVRPCCLGGILKAELQKVTRNELNPSSVGGV